MTTTVYIVTHERSIVGVFASESLAGECIRREAALDADFASEMVIEPHEVQG